MAGLAFNQCKGPQKTAIAHLKEVLSQKNEGMKIAIQSARVGLGSFAGVVECCSLAFTFCYPIFLKGISGQKIYWTPFGIRCFVKSIF